jgi:hypothetical protein
MSKLSQEQQAELMKFLDLEEAESLDKAKELFSQKFVKQEELSSKIGKITGSITNVARKAFEPFGVQLTEDDFKDKKIEDVLRSASEKASESFKNKISELESRATGQGSEELIKDWEKKYSTIEKKLQLKPTRQGKKALTAFESFKNEVTVKEKTSKINSVFDRALSSIKPDPSVNEITMKGFRSHINEKFSIELNENDEPVVMDRKTGERIKSDKKAGTFLGLEDVLMSEAATAGILQKNPNAGNKKPIVGGLGQRQPEAVNNTRSKGLSPRFLGM